MTVDSSYIRGIILGDIHFRKCSNCYGTGKEHWRWKDNDETDSEVISPQEYADSNESLRGIDECEVCDGMGFVETYRDEE